jgi:TRAP transporter TAXI family solute receptor
LRNATLAIVSGIPNASLADVQTVTSIRLLPIDVDRLKNTYPFYVSFLARAGTYKGMARDVGVVALKAMLVVRQEINSDLVYEMTKTLFEKGGDIGHGKAKEFDVTLAAQGVTIPFHPGAVKYFREKNLHVK